MKCFILMVNIVCLEHEVTTYIYMYHYIYMNICKMSRN